ncbi:hypothetical protein Tco_1343212 [Tanacetum coccineum]
MKILSVINLKTFSQYGYTFLREIFLCRADYKEYKISKADFKNLHPNDFKDLYLLHIQGNLNHLSGADKVHLFNAENEVHKFSDGMLTRILEKLDHMVKDYVLFKFNPGLENRSWYKDDKRRSKEFIKESSDPIPASFLLWNPSDEYDGPSRGKYHESIQCFLKKYDQIPSEEKCIALWKAEQKFLKDDDNDDDDYDKESIISLNMDMFETPWSDVITISLPIEEPKDSLIMEDEDIDTIPEKELDEENESSVENLFHIPSESEATSDNESECDLPVFDDSPLDLFEDNCAIFSRPLFDSYGDSTSKSISSDVNLIYDEVLEDTDGINYLIDSIIDFSPKIDPILEEFAGELALINLIPLGIAGADFDPEGDIHLIEQLSYDNSTPRPLEELNSEDIIYTTIHADISLPEYESFHFDISDYSLLLADKGDFVSETFNDDSTKEVQVQMPNVLPTHPTFFQSNRFLSLNKFSIPFISDPLSPVLETLLPFSFENEDKVFNPGILVSKEDKSPHLLSHRGNGYSQNDKNKAKTGLNRAQNWKERGKSKPKAYAS